MYKLPFASPERIGAAFLSACLVAASADSLAQAPSATQSQPAASVQSAPQAQPAAAPSPDDELLARAASLYYSTAKAGLDGFDCAVHPDWRLVFASASKDSTVADNDPRVSLLNSVGITLHAGMKGGSTLDWNPPANPGKPLDEDSIALLDVMHKATEQTLQGFMQFWAPFVDGSLVPDSSAGIDITHTQAGHTIHTAQNGTSMTEVYNSNLVLQQFNVEMNGAKVNFSPAYKSTDKGLLVNAFLAHIQPPDAPPGQTQEMRVAIEYQTIDGIPIPARINMDAVGTGTFNFVLDGCTVSKLPQ